MSKEGFALLEVVIAFTILVIVLVPTAAVYQQIVSVSASSRDRVVAANVASEQVNQAEATAFATLAAQVNTTQTSTVKEGGITYTVAQTSAWVNESNVANACGGTGNGSATAEPMLAVTETVTWPYMGVTAPVVSQTDMAAPPGYYSTSLGNLAISVVDSNSDAVVGASVTMTNTSSPYNSVTLPTGSTGCAFEAYLPTGAYTITAQLAGYVSMTEQSKATLTAVALGAGDTVGETINYAPAAVVPISYTSTAAQQPTSTTTTVASTTTTSTVASTTTTSTASTTTTSSSTTTTTTAPSNTITYPTNGYPVTIYNPTPGVIAYPAPLTGSLDLWPYSNGYDIYAGGCADNDPDYMVSGSRVYSMPYTPFSVSQGGTSPDTLQLYGLSITASSGDGTVSNIQVTLTDTTGGCSTNNTDPFTSVAGNSTNIAMPLGTFTIKVSGTAGPHNQAVTGTIGPLTETGSALAPQSVVLS